MSTLTLRTVNCEALNLDVGFYLFILLDKTTIDESDKPMRVFFMLIFILIVQQVYPL